MLGGDGAVRGQEGQRPAAGSLSEQHGHRGGVEPDEVVQGAGDLAGQAAFLGLLGQGRAGGVDDGEQRQPELLGQAHAAPGLPEGRRAHRRLSQCRLSHAVGASAWAGCGR